MNQLNCHLNNYNSSKIHPNPLIFINKSEKTNVHKLPYTIDMVEAS